MPGPRVADVLDAESVARVLPARPVDAHKFSFGVVVAVAGSLDYAGAAYMTALGTARSGAGMVALAVPDSLRPVFAGRLPEAIVLGLPEADGGGIDAAASRDTVLEREPAAIVFGPGLKESADYRAMLLELLATDAAPLVVDAGALPMLGSADEWWIGTRARCVLTPHAGEFTRLTGVTPGASDGERSAAAATASERFGQVVVLKGARTVISAPDGRMATSPCANPLLATAGSGDILAGYIGGLMGQGADPFDAACAGVFLHARAGERLAQSLGDAGLLATELALEMARARRDVLADRA